MRCALLLLAACGPHASSPKLDGAPRPDSPPTIDAPPDGPQPYRHTIMIDGIDDFTPAETFMTTSSPSYAARVTWDDHYLYIGYSGPDLATTTTDASTKWLFVALDVTAGGATQSLTYNTQHATFPTGFGADFYARYKCDGTFTTLERYDTASSTSWSTYAPAPQTAQSGTYLEMAISLSQLGAGSQLGVVTWMINENNNVESSYAGIFMDNFIDGYAANLQLTRYLPADFTAITPP
jgi:hypothetical protein